MALTIPEMIRATINDGKERSEDLNWEQFAGPPHITGIIEAVCEYLNDTVELELAATRGVLAKLSLFDGTSISQCRIVEDEDLDPKTVRWRVRSKAAVETRD